MQLPIILLHGLGGSPIQLFLLEAYLNLCGHHNTHRIRYPVGGVSLEESVTYVDSAIAQLTQTPRDQEEIIVIGHSMGGLVGNRLHQRGWSIRLAIYIGSPLHGATLLNQLEAVLPTWLRDCMYRRVYGLLQNKPREQAPPHPYHTISMAWPFTDFDGCVYKWETMLEEEHHTHLRCADHRTIMANPRLWTLVERLIASHLHPGKPVALSTLRAIRL